MTRAPAASVMPSIRPSTWAGTPATIVLGGVPSRAGQALRTRSWLPPMPPLVTITACAAQLEVADLVAVVGRPRSAPSGSSVPPARRRRPRRRRPGRRPGAGSEADPAARDVLADPPLERLDHARAGAPGDVEARHRVAVPVGAAVAALGPADDREDPVAHLAQPGALLAGREVDVRLGPGARPAVLLAVELGAAEPVLHGELAGVLDAHPALLGAVDEEQPAEAPERLPAQGLLALLVEQQHRPAGVGHLGGGRQPGQAGPDHDDVCVHEPRVRWAASRWAASRRARRAAAGWGHELGHV